MFEFLTVWNIAASPYTPNVIQTGWHFYSNTNQAFEAFLWWSVQPPMIGWFVRRGQKCTLKTPIRADCSRCILCSVFMVLAKWAGSEGRAPCVQCALTQSWLGSHTLLKSHISSGTRRLMLLLLVNFGISSLLAGQDLGRGGGVGKEGGGTSFSC